MYPVLVAGGGIVTVLWDNKNSMFHRLKRVLGIRGRRSSRESLSPPASSGIDRSTDARQRQENGPVERIELPVLGSGAEDQDVIRPVSSMQPETLRPAYIGADSKRSVSQQDAEQGQSEGIRQRTQVKDDAQAFPTTATLEAAPDLEDEETQENMHTLDSKVAGALFVLFVILIITFVVLKGTLKAPSRELSLFTK
jgi:hypothetical protein